MCEKNLVVISHVLVRWLTDFGNVINFMHREGYRLTFVTHRPVHLPFASPESSSVHAKYRNLLPRDSTYVLIPHSKGKFDPLGWLRSAMVAVRLGRQHPDGLFMFWGTLNIVVMGLPLRVMNRKCLFMVTGLGSLNDGTKKSALYARAVMPLFTFLFNGRNSRVLSHNHEEKQFIVERTGVEPSTVVVTPGCGVDPVLFPYFEKLPENDPPIILVPTRLIVLKGVLEAFAASRILKERGVKHEMWFTGVVEPFYSSMRLEHISQEQLDRAGQENPCVKFLGYVEDLVSVYEQCDIVLYPTRYPEGMPTVLVEAAACGRPVVTTDNIGCRDFSTHEVNALVAPTNDPGALANLLERMIADRPLRERLRRNAYAKFRAEFTNDVVLERTVDAFKSMGHVFHEELTARDIRLIAAE